MSGTRILLVRHGHTVGNGSGADVPLTGWADVPLDELGRREADRLRGALVDVTGLDAVYSSSSRRALETAERACPPALRARLTVLDDLREIYCGAVDGRPVRVVEEQFPALWRDNERQDDADFRWPGGESYREFRARCLRVLDGLMGGGRARVLVFTHAGVISQLVGSIHGTDPARWACHRPRTCSLTEVLWGPDRREVRVFDDCRHLACADALA